MNKSKDVLSTAVRKYYIEWLRLARCRYADLTDRQLDILMSLGLIEFNRKYYDLTKRKPLPVQDTVNEDKPVAVELFR